MKYLINVDVDVFMRENRTYEIEANSEEEAKDKAIEDNCWEKNPNEVLLGYEYIAIKDDK